jgi:hypothetical protein
MKKERLTPGYRTKWLVCLSAEEGILFEEYVEDGECENGCGTNEKGAWRIITVDESAKHYVRYPGISICIDCLLTQYPQVFEILPTAKMINMEG